MYSLLAIQIQKKMRCAMSYSIRKVLVPPLASGKQDTLSLEQVTRIRLIYCRTTYQFISSNSKRHPKVYFCYQ